MDLNEWMQLPTDEKKSALHDAMADIGEVWMGDSIDDQLVRAMVGAMRGMFDASIALQEAGDSNNMPNPYVAGLWLHLFQRMTGEWPALVAMTDMKKKMGQ